MSDRKRPDTSERNFKHGFALRGKKQHPIYRAWRSMRRRCRDRKSKDWKNYGGRGITVCKDWMGFEAFLNDMLPTWKSGLMLERVDNSKGYSKENCKWATRQEQNLNKRNLHLLTVNGETHPISVWAERLHPTNKDFIYVRLRRGWTPEEAVTIPVGKLGTNKLRA